MATRKKGGGARKAPARDYDSLLLRSAESLGRVIGALQRQLDTVSRRLAAGDGDGNGAGAGKPDGEGAPKPSRTAARKRSVSPKVIAGSGKQVDDKTSRKSTRPR